MNRKSRSDEANDTEFRVPEPWELERAEITLHFHRRPVSLQSGGKSKFTEGIRESARNQTEAIFVGEVQVEFTVYTPGITRMEATTIGDLDNLIKPVFDAFNNVVWLDDRQVQAIDAQWIDSPHEPHFMVRVVGFGAARRSELAIWKIENHYFQGHKKPHDVNDRDWIARLVIYYCIYKKAIGLMEYLEENGVSEQDRRRLMPMSYIPFVPADEWIVDWPDDVSSLTIDDCD